MRVVGVLLLTYLWFAIPGFSQTEEAKISRIEISERSWDFGTVPPGGKVTHGFIIKNSGQDTVRLIKIRLTCSCTSAPLKKQVLAPGDTTRLEVTFNSGSFSGPVSRLLYLQSDDPVEPMLELGVSVTVGYRGKQLEFEPLLADFDTVRALPARAALRMKNIDSMPVSVSLLEVPGGVHLSVPPAPVAAGEETFVKIVWEKPPAGEFHASFTLVCGDPKKSRYTIPVRGFYKPAK